MNTTPCSLCSEVGGALIVQAPKFRLIRADEDADLPAFYRLVWSAHLAEFSDLSSADQAHCMSAVAEVERVLRAHLQPTKINLAALGNVVPHLHWHIIARFAWDTRFPAPVWAAPQRAAERAACALVLAKRAKLERALVQRLAPWCQVS